LPAKLLINSEFFALEREIRQFSQDREVISDGGDGPNGQAAWFLDQENCKVRGLVHFSAKTARNPAWMLPENMDLTRSRCTLAVLLVPR
jgi:hypothetical protein